MFEFDDPAHELAFGNVRRPDFKTRLTTGKYAVDFPNYAPDESLADCGISLTDAQLCVQRLAFHAIDDASAAAEYAQAVAAAIAADPKPKTVLRNRVYKDRLEAGDAA